MEREQRKGWRDLTGDQWDFVIRVVAAAVLIAYGVGIYAGTTLP